jgi:hypothetical protein
LEIGDWKCPEAETMDARNFRALRVWETGMELAEEVYRLSWQFPRHETYGLGVRFSEL